MPRQVDPSRIHFAPLKGEVVGVVIPQSATMHPHVKSKTENSLNLQFETLSAAGAFGPATKEQMLAEITKSPTQPPNKFALHYIEEPIDESWLNDDATIENGVYEFSVRDAVVGVFDLPAMLEPEFCWSFLSTYHQQLVASITIGETFDVDLPDDPTAVYHVSKSMQSPVSDTGENCACHIVVDDLRPRGFRVVSSYEPGSPPAASHINLTLRVFGTAANGPDIPLWRELLGYALRQSLIRNWAHALLYTAFSIESFIDERMDKKLSAGGFGDKYIGHLLRVAERKFELKEIAPVDVTQSGADSESKRLNKEVFTPRNGLAHGKRRTDEITSDEVVVALKRAVEFIWKWDRESRSLLLPRLKRF